MSLDRRTFITLSAGGAIGSLSGCLETSSTVGDMVEEQSRHSGETDLNVEISTSGPALLITPTEGLPIKATLLQHEDQIASVEMTGVGRPAYQEIIHCETAGDPNNRLFEPGTIELVFTDVDGNEMGRKEWEFRPQPVVEDFTIATVSDYNPDDHLSETTPVFKLHNVGTGPTCLSSIEIKNPQATVSIARDETTVDSPMLQTGAYSISNPRVSIYDSPVQDSKLLPAGRDYYLAIGGLFTASLPNGAPTPNAPHQISQTFDMVIHTAYGESHTTTIDIAMVGGITTSNGDAPWTHRYRTIRLNDVSYRQP